MYEKLRGVAKRLQQTGAEACWDGWGLLSICRETKQLPGIFRWAGFWSTLDFKLTITTTT